MENQKKNNKGFSLVDLIVVVAIMAVLMGVLVPTLVRNVEKSKKQKDINNLAEIRSAIQTTMASEEFSGLTGTMTITKDPNKGFTLSTTSSYAGTGFSGFDSTNTEQKFWTEVLANLNGGADYRYDYTSKLKDATKAIVVFTFSNEKVTGVLNVEGCPKRDYNGSIQLQDKAQSST